MNDTYDAGYLPDDADCDQDSIRVELAYSHDFYTAIIEGQEERIAELEKEKKILYIEAQIDGIELVADWVDGYYAPCVVGVVDELAEELKKLREGK